MRDKDDLLVVEAEGWLAAEERLEITRGGLKAEHVSRWAKQRGAQESLHT